ncbi:hypothetical protein ES705_48153 [subsurface metagenome]
MAEKLCLASDTANRNAIVLNEFVIHFLTIPCVVPCQQANGSRAAWQAARSYYISHGSSNGVGSLHTTPTHINYTVLQSQKLITVWDYFTDRATLDIESTFRGYPHSIKNIHQIFEIRRARRMFMSIDPLKHLRRRCRRWLFRCWRRLFRYWRRLFRYWRRCFFSTARYKSHS